MLAAFAPEQIGAFVRAALFPVPYQPFHGLSDFSEDVANELLFLLPAFLRKASGNQNDTHRPKQNHHQHHHYYYYYYTTIQRTTAPYLEIAHIESLT